MGVGQGWGVGVDVISVVMSFLMSVVLFVMAVIG